MDHVCWAQVVCCAHLFLTGKLFRVREAMDDVERQWITWAMAIRRYHEQKLIGLPKVPTNYIENLTLWCMDWDKRMHQLVTLEHNWRLIQRWGKDGSDQQFRKDLSHNGAVRLGGD